MLLANGYASIAHDVRGVGESEAPDKELGSGQFTFVQFSRDAATLLTELRVTRVTACGMAWGSRYAMKLFCCTRDS